MTAAAAGLPARPAVTAAALLTGFAAAVGLRVAIGGTAVAASAAAGLAFAAALGALTLAAPPRTRAAAGRTLLWAATGTAVLCAPATLAHLVGGTQPHRAAGFVPWAAVVAVVAVTEEAFLRGALHDQLLAWRGPPTAILVSTACFAALHVPLYGWHSVALNAAAGLWLATLRHCSGTWTAPALAHTAADLVSWWLR